MSKPRARRLSSPKRWSPKKRKKLFQNEEEDTRGECLNDELLVPAMTETNLQVIHNSSNVEADLLQSEIIDALKLELRSKNEEINRLNEELITLKWTEQTFVNDIVKLKFFTALPNLDVLHLILHYTDEYLDDIKVSGMSNFQKLLLTLMKLRHNYVYTDLAYRFHIDVKQVSRIFKGVIRILYAVFKDLVHWPDRDCLRSNVPQCFRERFGNQVAIIIDCFEIFTESPATIKARAEIFSAYKGHYTIKYLLGITTHGCVSFVSEGWGGRVSDKEITEQCGILDNLLPGDVVLADRGFTVAETIGLHQASLNIPAFTRKKKQLLPAEVELTRKIASVRIHVERVIGLLRNKFTILKSRLPIILLKNQEKDKILIDKIVHVCCCLANMCEQIIPDKVTPSKKYRAFTKTTSTNATCL